MIEFYKKAAKYFCLLIVITLLAAALCAFMFYGRDELLPANKSPVPWHIKTIQDRPADGGSSIAVLNQSEQLEFEYTLNSVDEFPYVKLLMVFQQTDGQSNTANFSHYYKVSFDVECTPGTVATLNLRTHDPKVTRAGDYNSYRFASHWFDCSDQSAEEQATLTSLEVPLWWLVENGISVHDRTYRLDQVFALSFDSSKHGVVGMPTRIRVSRITLHHYQWEYLVVFALFCCCAWISFWVWAFKLHSTHLANDIRAKIVHDKPLVAYQKLSITSHKDKEKRAVLEYLAKHYANPDLNMELLIQELGVNRKKVNEILREEMGFTFKAYVNKLRLTEAARLVCDQPNASINEVAFSVGYKNVTHFNKLFKEEFGCAPNKFKKLNLASDTFTDDE
jgi:AraC-like DNA-binding protein